MNYMDSRYRPLVGRHLLLCVGGLLAGAFLAPAVMAASETAATPGRPVATAAPCPLGSLECPPRPVSFARCRPNALFDFYRPDLPRDTRGQETADTHVRALDANAAQPDLYQFTGDVSMRRYDQYLTADKANYNDKTTAFDAQGNVTWQDASILLSADRVHGATASNYAQAENVQYQLLDARGNGIAAHSEMRNSEHHNFTTVTYSTCDPDKRLWHIDARQMTTDKITGRGKARGAKIKVGNVPILYLPYFNFPIDDRRQTGFLYPTIGSMGSSAVALSIPYYLNLAPNYDATLTPHYYNGRGMALGGQFRYLFKHGEGQFDIDYMPEDHNAAASRGGFERNLSNRAKRYLWSFENRSRLSPHWRFVTTMQRASDSFYFQDFRSYIRGISTPSTLHSQGYFIGSGEWWSARVGADHYQNVDPDPDYRNTPYKRWPRGVLELDQSINRYLTVGMDNEFVAFKRDAFYAANGQKRQSVEGQRLDLYPWIEANMQGAAWYVRPRFAWRHTSYHLTRDPNNAYQHRNPSRSLPITSIDSGLIFERPVTAFKNDYTQTLEPRLYYLYVPYRNQDDIPVFDSRDMTFAWWQLFTPNRFSGADRQMNANNLTLAVTSRFLNREGVERAAFSVGQIRYLTSQKVQRGRYQDPIRDSGSDYVAQMQFQINDNWRVSTTYQWDPNRHHPSVGTVQTQRRIGKDGMLNFSYRYRDQFMEQFDTSAVIPVNDRWRMVGRWNYLLRDRPNKYNDNRWARGNPKTLSALLGVEYDSCCVTLGLYAHHYVRNTRGKTDNAVMFQVQFKGLGNFSPETDELLRQSIPGYR